MTKTDPQAMLKGALYDEWKAIGSPERLQVYVEGKKIIIEEE